MLHGVHFVIVKAAAVRDGVAHRWRLLRAGQQTHQQQRLVQRRCSSSNSCCRCCAARQLLVADAVAAVALAAADLLLLVASQRGTQWILAWHIDEQAAGVAAGIAAAVGIADDVVGSTRCVLYGLGAVTQTDVAN